MSLRRKTLSSRLRRHTTANSTSTADFPRVGDLRCEDLSPLPEFTGNLRRLGESGSNGRLRFVVLTGNILRFYKDSHRQKLCEEFNLEDSCTNIVNATGFEIRLESRIIRLKAESQSEMGNWVAHISAVSSSAAENSLIQQAEQKINEVSRMRNECFIRLRIPFEQPDDAIEMEEFNK